jgi:hypothetical protein
MSLARITIRSALQLARQRVTIERNGRTAVVNYFGDDRRQRRSTRMSRAQARALLSERRASEALIALGAEAQEALTAARARRPRQAWEDVVSEHMEKRALTRRD